MRKTFLLLFAAGCASGGAVIEGTDATSRQPMVYSSSETGTILGEKPRASSLAVAAAPAAVWLAAKKAYADLDIPLVIENPAARQMGNQNFYRSRQLAGQPMTQFVDCGSGMTGPKASTYRIYISLITDVIPDGNGGTNLKTTFVPMGQDVSGGSADRIPCGTTGRFEQLFLANIKAAIGK